jgi:transglutaminase-like putative cysteine protease
LNGFIVRYEVIHRTTYEYETPVSVSLHLARLTPRTFPGQRCLEYELEIDPQPGHIGTHQDYFGNTVTVTSIEGAHRELVFNARSSVETTARSLPSAGSTTPWESVRDRARNNDYRISGFAGEFSYPTALTPRLPGLVEYAGASFPKSRPILEGAMDLTGRIHKDFSFDPRATNVATPLGEVFRKRRGVCQDFAHLQIACLRALGLPARYVSGYLETLPPPGKPKLVGADASHAWVQVFVPGSDWVDLDPTNNMPTADRHITLAWGRDFDEISPIRGVIVGGGEHELKVAVDVTPVG